MGVLKPKRKFKVILTKTEPSGRVNVIEPPVKAVKAPFKVKVAGPKSR